MIDEYYQWTKKDKALYLLSMIPFLIVFFGTTYLLSIYSIFLSIILWAMFILTNVFQAGCCIGCPYRGKYCPALCGVYLGNFLSILLYKNRVFDKEFFEKNAAAGEMMLVIMILFPIYWIIKIHWLLLPLYLILLASHFFLFMPTQCEKCGYKTICPGGITWQRCRTLLKKSN